MSSRCSTRKLVNWQRQRVCGLSRSSSWNPYISVPWWKIQISSSCWQSMITEENSQKYLQMHRVDETLWGRRFLGLKIKSDSRTRSDSSFLAPCGITTTTVKRRQLLKLPRGLQPTVEGISGLGCLRADDIYDNRAIIEDIWRYTNGSQVGTQGVTMMDWSVVPDDVQWSGVLIPQLLQEGSGGLGVAVPRQFHNLHLAGLQAHRRIIAGLFAPPWAGRIYQRPALP